MNRFSWKESGGRTNTTNWGGASTARRGEKSWRGSRGSHGSSGSISSPLQSLWEGLPSTNLLCEISLNEIVSSISSKEVTPTIQDSEILASYSWLDRAQATILIPGTCRYRCARIGQLLFADMVKESPLHGLRLPRRRLLSQTVGLILETRMPPAILDIPWSRPYGQFL